MNSLFEQIINFIRQTAVYAWQWLSENQATAAQLYSGLLRWLAPLLALAILIGILRSMLRARNPGEVWGYLCVETASDNGFDRVEAADDDSDDVDDDDNDDLDDDDDDDDKADLFDGGNGFALRHWEAVVGRSRYCDVTLNLPTVSRNQCSLTRRDDGSWRVHELSAQANTCVNGRTVGASCPISGGDRLSFGGVELIFRPSDYVAQARERREDSSGRILRFGRPLLLLTLFQALSAVELMLRFNEAARAIGLCYGLLCAAMWLYVLVNRASGRRGFEVELLAFFSCTVSLSVVAAAYPGPIIKQTVAILAGLLLFVAIGVYLRDLNRALRIRYLMAGAAVGLLSLSLIFGVATNGAQNWISIAGVSLQPSELAKICFIFAGAASLERLYARHNLWGFILFSFTCMGMLGLMSDFGGAAIFFVVFIVIAYLRSGDFATLSLISAGCALALGLVLRFKPYVAARFAAWGHAWEYASSGGYQQVRSMSAAASGGLIGVGAGNGWLRHVVAGDTDLVFALVCEEWGLIISLLLVAGVICLAVFAVRVTRSGRSSFYTIAACAAASLMVFQTSLNVLGSVDILPLTGVTFPFLSNGGSSMLASWGLLAFIKAGDTRSQASFAVRGPASRLVQPPAADDRPGQAGKEVKPV